MAIAVRSSMSSATGIGRNGLYTWLSNRSSISSIGTSTQPDSRRKISARLSLLRITSQSTADGEHAVVVGEDATLGVEDAAAFGQQRDRAQLGGVDLGLQRLVLDRLEEPETSADEAEQQHADEREHAEARRALVSGHACVGLRSEVGST